MNRQSPAMPENEPDTYSQGHKLAPGSYICQKRRMKISPVEKADIPAIEAIVNGAYRGDHSKKGWTSEADLIDGSLRTDQQNLLHILQTPGATILKYADENGVINGCVYLQLKDHYMELGMLSVNPELQAAGIGKRLLAAATEHARKNHKSKIKLKVISRRKELVAWYERHGFKFNGEEEPMPPHANFGRPREPLFFITMVKMV